MSNSFPNNSSSNLSNYLLSSLMITVNISTAYFIFPIISEFIQIYNKYKIDEYHMGIYIGFTIGGYEIARTLGSFIWKKIAVYIGVPLSINISLLAITTLNSSCAFTKSINTLILIRVVTGLLNNLSTFSKQYIIGMFNHDQHKKVARFIILCQNFSAAFTFITGMLSVVSDSDSIFENQYYLISFFNAFLCFITLLFNLIKFQFRMTIPRRSSQFFEQYEGNVVISQRKESVPVNNDNNKFEVNKFNSPMKNPNLKDNSNVINLDGYSSTNTPKNDLANNFSDFHSNCQKEDIFTKKESLANEEEGNAFPNQTGYMNREKSYIKLEENSKLSGHHSRFSGRPMVNLNIEGKKIDSSIASDATVDVKKDISVPKITTSNKQMVYKVQNILQKCAISDIKETSSDKPKSSIANDFLSKDDEKGNKNLINHTLSKANSKVIIKIVSIFTILQICEVILNNVYLLFLILPSARNFPHTSFSLTEVCIFLTLLHFLYSLIVLLTRSESLKIVEKTNLSMNYSHFRLFTIISIFFNFVFSICYFILKQKNKLHAGIFAIILILRNLFLSKVLTNFNILIFNIPSVKIKDKIYQYQNSVSFILRGVFVIISCSIITYFGEFSIFVFIFIFILPMAMLTVNYCLIEKVKELVIVTEK